jgi:hypothetical protein
MRVVRSLSVIRAFWEGERDWVRGKLRCIIVTGLPERSEARLSASQEGVLEEGSRGKRRVEEGMRKVRLQELRVYVYDEKPHSRAKS